MRIVSVMTELLCVGAWIVVAALLWSLEAAQDNTVVSFSPDFSQQITYLGDASYEAGAIRLTLDPIKYPFIHNSSGIALFSSPVRLRDQSDHTVASFSTLFSFTVSPLAASGYGDGLAFIIVYDAKASLEPAFELGLYDKSTASAAQHTFAVEFVTRRNEAQGKVHVENTSFLVAEDTANVIFRGNGRKTVWIDYNGASHLLEVRLGNDALRRPVIPLISARFNLSEAFKEFMFVGFCAARVGGQELHSIVQWSFSIWGLHQAMDRSSKSGILAGLAVGVAGAAIATVGVIAWLVVHGKLGGFRRAEAMEKDMQQMFTFKEIKAATRSFSDCEKLDHPRLGSVYRGVLPRSGAVVAVKRLTHAPLLKAKAFLPEINSILRLRHRNLVQLHGWCSDGVDLLLVYEFLPNGSLDCHLFESKDTLSWTHRYKIVCGIAAALLHLHEEAEECIIHRDVKPSNVILDHNFNPKLGDFGFARLIDQRHGSSANTVVAGTFGYVAPEAVQNGKATTKTDVFSFGAVLLEVGCGRRALDPALPEDQTVLVDWLWSLHEQGRILEAADERLGSAYDVQEMELLLKLGLLCSEADPAFRPCMRQVMLILSGDAPLPQLPPPSKCSSTPDQSCTTIISLEHVLANSVVVHSRKLTISNTPEEEIKEHFSFGS